MFLKQVQINPRHSSEWSSGNSSIQVLGIERAHRVGNKNNKRNAQRTIVPKLYSYKDKQIVLSVAIKLKGKNQTLKETPVYQSRKTEQNEEVLLYLFAIILILR